MNKTLLLAAVLPLALHAAPRIECDEIRGRCVDERIVIEPVKVTAKPIVTAIELAKPGPIKTVVAVSPPKPPVPPKPVVFFVPPKPTPPPPRTIYFAPKIVPVTKAPELATGGIATALTLMIGGLLVIRGRKAPPSV